jgi:hypothetical protein
MDKERADKDSFDVDGYRLWLSTHRIFSRFPTTWVAVVPAPTRRDDWMPEHPKSSKFRGLLSKYNSMLELVARPLTSVRSTVTTSPLA